MDAPVTVAAARRAPLVALVTVALALGAALLGPRLFGVVGLDTDPVSIDPFQVRLAAVSLALLGVAALSPALVSTRPVLLGVAAVAAPFCLWAASPSIVDHLVGDRAGYRTTVLLTDIVYLAATVPFAVAAVRWLAPGQRPALRLAGLPRRALLATAAGVLGLLALALALPADLLGRDGLAVSALARDLPLLAPACALQGLVQELQFRGLLLGALERSLPFWAANLGQAGLFGLAHIAVQFEGPQAPFVPVTIALGAALGWVTRWSGSLWPAIAIHAALDVASLTVLPGLYGY